MQVAGPETQDDDAGSLKTIFYTLRFVLFLAGQGISYLESYERYVGESKSPRVDRHHIHRRPCSDGSDCRFWPRAWIRRRNSAELSAAFCDLRCQDAIAFSLFRIKKTTDQ